MRQQPQQSKYSDAVLAAARRRNIAHLLGQVQPATPGAAITVADFQRQFPEPVYAIREKKDPKPGTTGGRPSLVVQQRSFFKPWDHVNQVEIDVFGPNPLLEDLKQADPTTYQRALSLNPTPPTLFTAGDLPLFTGSGVDPAYLRKLPYVWRHQAAAADAVEAAEIFERYATNSVGAWFQGMAALDALRSKGALSDQLAAYQARMRDWSEALPAQQPGYRPISLVAGQPPRDSK